MASVNLERSLVLAFFWFVAILFVCIPAVLWLSRRFTAARALVAIITRNDQDELQRLRLLAPLLFLMGIIVIVVNLSDPVIPWLRGQ